MTASVSVCLSDTSNYQPIDIKKLIDLLRNEGEKDDGLISRLLLCRFLATSSLIVLARSEDHIERAVSIWDVPV